MRRHGAVADRMPIGGKPPDRGVPVQRTRPRHPAAPDLFLRRRGIAFERQGALGTRVMRMFGALAGEADATPPPDATPKSTSSLASVASR